MSDMMKLRAFRDAAEFYDKIRNFQSERSIENDLMLGLTYLLVEDPNHFDTEPFLMTVEEKGETALCAFMTPPWNMLVNSKDESVEPMEYLIDYLLENGISIPGVNGPANISGRFAQIWCENTGDDFKLHMETRLFIIKKVESIRRSHGEMIKADMGHLEILKEWGKRFHNDVGMKISDDFLRKHAEYGIKTGNAFLWIDEEPVCMTFRERAHEDGISIGYVYTPEQFRNRGYATNLVASVSQLSLDTEYSYCSLFTDLANPTSNSIYRKIGYRPVCDYNHYNFIKTNQK